MKILFLISRFLDGGIDTVLVEYLNALCRLTNHEVTLAIGMKMNEAEVLLPRISSKVNISYLVDQDWLTVYKRQKHHHQKNKLKAAFDEICLNPIRRMQMHRRLQYLSRDKDAVIDFDSCQGAFMADIPAGVKKIAWFHFSLAQEARRDSKRIERLKRRFVQYDRIVLIADDMMKEAISIAPEFKTKYCRIYNCLNKDIILQKVSTDVADSRMHSPYFLAIERLEESQKDLTTLIRAYSLLPANAPLLYIIGEGRSRLELETLISELQLTERIVLLGFQSNPYPWLSRAIALVHSSKFEGLPTVLIEALLLGKLVISTNCPVGPSEILDNGKSGILVPVGDAETLARAMQRVMDNDAELQTILNNAKVHQQMFLPEFAIKQLEALLETK